MSEWTITGDYFEDIVLDTLLQMPGAQIQHFFFEGNPVPLGRQRTALIKKKDGKQFIANYSPAQNKFNKDKIYCACLQAAPIRFEPPYTIAVKFICEPLKTVAEKYPTAASHGDLDNCVKLIWDSLFNEKPKGPLPIYRDDRHIINCLMFKRLPQCGEKPGIHFWMIKCK